jgi:high-affinity nickel-transport protein
LLAIGVLNLLVLLDIARIFRDMRRGGLDESRLEERLLDRGLMSRGLLRRLGARITSGWHMYPRHPVRARLRHGDRSACYALRAATHHVPFLAILSLPLLFAAGMSLMDTADGAFWHAYGWAFSSPVRKVYNLTVTTLSVTVALGIGMIELLQVAARSAWLDFNTLGYAMVALFVLTWAISAVIWKTQRIEERWAGSMRGANL